MLTLRTMNIIKICKSNNKPDNTLGDIQRISKYLSKECCCPLQYYTPELTGKIIREALYDYLNNCDHAGEALRELDNYRSAGVSDSASICCLFAAASVQDGNGRFVNGFDNRWFRVVNPEV